MIKELDFTYRYQDYDWKLVLKEVTKENMKKLLSYLTATFDNIIDKEVFVVDGEKLFVVLRINAHGVDFLFEDFEFLKKQGLKLITFREALNKPYPCFRGMLMYLLLWQWSL